MGHLVWLWLAVAAVTHPSASPMSWGESRMATDGPLSEVNAIVVRLDPARLHLQLELASVDYGIRAAWTVDQMPDDGIAAFNAGQFIGGIPWGWVVIDGVERQEPGTGRLAMSLVIDEAGAPALVTPDERLAVRKRARFALQSYPMLLSGNGETPWELRGPGRGVDLAHRDSRLAIGTRRDGSVIVVLTRFAGAGAIGARLPWGPTVPEMAAFMRSLGCERAMMLDGGISSQLAVRGTDGAIRSWSNFRKVPLAIIATRRAS